jgi:hypothetical protein
MQFDNPTLSIQHYQRSPGILLHNAVTAPISAALQLCLFKSNACTATHCAHAAGEANLLSQSVKSSIAQSATGASNGVPWHATSKTFCSTEPQSGRPAVQAVHTVALGDLAQFCTNASEQLTTPFADICANKMIQQATRNMTHRGDSW